MTDENVFFFLSHSEKIKIFYSDCLIAYASSDDFSKDKCNAFDMKSYAAVTGKFVTYHENYNLDLI